MSIEDARCSRAKGLERIVCFHDFLGRSAKLYEIVNCWFIELGIVINPIVIWGLHHKLRNPINRVRPFPSDL